MAVVSLLMQNIVSVQPESQGGGHFCCSTSDHIEAAGRVCWKAAVLILSQNFASADRAMAARQIYTTRSVIVKVEFFSGEISSTCPLIFTVGQNVRFFGLVAQQ